MIEPECVPLVAPAPGVPIWQTARLQYAATADVFPTELQRAQATLERSVSACCDCARGAPQDTDFPVHEFVKQAGSDFTALAHELFSMYARAQLALSGTLRELEQAKAEARNAARKASRLDPAASSAAAPSSAAPALQATVSKGQARKNPADSVASSSRPPPATSTPSAATAPSAALSAAAPSSAASQSVQTFSQVVQGTQLAASAQRPFPARARPPSPTRGASAASAQQAAPQPSQQEAAQPPSQRAPQQRQRGRRAGRRVQARRRAAQQASARAPAQDGLAAFLGSVERITEGLIRVAASLAGPAAASRPRGRPRAAARRPPGAAAPARPPSAPDPAVSEVEPSPARPDLKRKPEGSPGAASDASSDSGMSVSSPHGAA
jgi:hypothetical protein